MCCSGYWTIFQSLNTFIFKMKIVLFYMGLKDGAILWQIIIITMGSYNARVIYPIGYSRRRCGATAAIIRQPQTHPHNEEPEIRNRILWEGVRFLGVGGNRSARRKPTKAGMESANQIHIQPLARCTGERKVYATSTRSTRLATGVVCHPDTEQNRPYKNPWSW